MRRLFLFILLIWVHYSFAQKDTLDYTITNWNLDQYQNKIELSVDTFLDGFQTYIPIYRQDYSQAYNGNMGQAHQSNNFRNRKQNSFFFFTPYYAYLFLPENAKFYNTKQQYTQLRYYTNFSKHNSLQNLDLLHTQNITPYLNLGFQYRLIGADGEYKAQKSRNHFFRAFASYEQKKYTAHLVYNYNKFNSFLNGGIVSDTLLDNPYNKSSDRKTIPVFLEQSKNTMLGRNLNLKQHYKIFESLPTDSIDSLSIENTYSILIGHELNWNYNKRIYSNEGSPGFYQQFFQDTNAISGSLAIDSTGYMNFNNRFFITLPEDSTKPYLPTITFAYQNTQEFFHSYRNTQSNMNHIVSLYLTHFNNKKWLWYIDANYTFAGAFKTDYSFTGKIQKFLGKNQQQHIYFKSSLSQQNPNVFSQNYASNFYKWENSFKATKTSVFDLVYTNEKLKLQIGIQETFLKNYIYFASKQDSVWEDKQIVGYDWIAGYPFQETKNFDVLSIYMKHRLDYKAFHMLNAVTYQKTSNDSVLHIPEFTYYNSTYFQMRFFKRVLTVQVGFDLRYNTAYYIDGFMPATGLYYNQYQKKAGYYPYVDFFVNMKLKRALIFFKLDHFNNGFSGTNYYTVLNHPMNPRIFRFGLSWRFYN